MNADLIEREINRLRRQYEARPQGRAFAPLADSYRKAGRLDEALELCHEGLNYHPGYSSAHVILGKIHLDRNDLDQARSAFESVMALDPDNLVALRHLAIDATFREDNDRAVEFWGRVLALDPFDEEAEAEAERLAALAAGNDPAGEETTEADAPSESPAEDVAAEDVASEEVATEEVAAFDEPSEPIAADETVEEMAADEADENSVADPDADDRVEEIVTDETADETRADEDAAEEIAADEDEVDGETAADEVPEEIAADAVAEEIAADEVADEIAADDVPDEIAADEVPDETSAPEETPRPPEPVAEDETTAVTGAEGTAPADSPQEEEAWPQFTTPEDVLQDESDPAESSDEEDSWIVEPLAEAKDRGPEDEAVADEVADDAPDSDSSPTAAGAAETSASGASDFATMTLADIYFEQGFQGKALEMYRSVYRRSPRTQGLAERIASIEASLSGNVPPENPSPREPETAPASVRGAEQEAQVQEPGFSPANGGAPGDLPSTDPRDEEESETFDHFRNWLNRRTPRG